ncbi:myoD family inhibitor domain-containing protein 2 [Epinephelus lanceolatus]|uniref:myoD family inhibitor domain-containing protein 2 n=1 Tax=Epinephelus lanceolatus TaxID=310571 RepID=UPI001446D635|nr:myoD family inhibitor domain-containing protein 2 [Epinephelus lanceolatus]
MDQMADEMTLRADVKDKGRVNSAEESSTWVRGERMQSEAQGSDWRLGASADTEPGDTGRDTDTQRPRECDSSSSPLFSLKMYLRRSSSTASSSTDSLSSSQQIDCAGIVLNCLFCRFYDMILMLPDSCERVVNRCCPTYKQVITAMESAPSSNDESRKDWDCGLFNSCHDASDCLELAMEISELCYH